MTRLDTWTLSEDIRSPVATGAADDDMLSSWERDSSRAAWQELIDRKLIKWGRDPSPFEDDGPEPPSAKAVWQACHVAQVMRDVGAPAAIRVVPDGDGGISFERRVGSVSESIEIDREGAIELITIVDSRLVSRQRLN